MCKNFVSPDEVHIIPAWPGFSVVHLCPFDRCVERVPLVAWDVTIDAKGNHGERMVVGSDSFLPSPLYFAPSSFPRPDSASIECPNGSVVDPLNDACYSSVDQWRGDQLVYVWLQIECLDAVHGEISYRDFARFERAVAGIGFDSETEKLDTLGVSIKGSGSRSSYSLVQIDGQGDLRLSSIAYEHPEQAKNDVPKLVFRKVEV